MVYWQWLVIALGFFILEMFAPGAILLWFGIGAGLLGLLLLPVPDIPLPAQLLIFAALSLAGVLIGRRYIRWRPVTGDKPNLSRRGEAYIGKTFTLLKDMENGVATVRIGDTDWRVEAADGAHADHDGVKGAKVKVVGIEGASLQVVQS